MAVLKGRVEGNIRAGNERSIYMTEMWVPIAQDVNSGSVLYGDLRIMGDNQENKEFNLGIGYRKMVESALLGEGIIGVHTWLDRRITARGSKFNQTTLGLEWFSDDWDVKINGYLPINDRKRYVNTNPNAPGFVGTQLVAYTDQTTTEEALTGADLELGWRVHFLDNYTDSTRIYAGAYHFEGDKADRVSGWRTRLTSDITSDIQIGARFQKDDTRGSQGFLEATIRFPFGQKKSYQEHGLRARLDESPERDIDIVSGATQTDPGQAVALTASDGSALNVIHVDNSAGVGGDGSAGSPFDTLAAAQAAATTNDLIYVHYGDGTTTGMANGITIDDVGQKLIGSGTNLTASMLNLSIPDSITNLNENSVLIAATQAPTITNGAGNGVDITASGVTLAGFTVTGASDNGIRASNNVQTWESLTIRDITSNNNSSDGIDIVLSSGASVIENLSISNVTANDSQNDSGIQMFLNSGSRIDSADISNVTTNTNSTQGIYFIGFGTSQITNATIDTATIDDNFRGLYVRARQDSVFNVHATNITSTRHNNEGVYLLAQENGTLNFSMSSSTLTTNSTFGIRLADSSTNAINADIGGGAFAAAGNNSIFLNNSNEVSVDLDGGNLKAENNWWGVNTGLPVGEISLIDASTIDADPFLTSAP